VSPKPAVRASGLIGGPMPEKEPRPDTEPLVRALNRAGIGGMPAAVWAAIATALAPAGVHYSPADVESFARAHPDQVDRHETRDGPCYQPPFDPQREAIKAVLAVPSIERGVRELIGPSTVEDDVAVALVGLLRTSADDPGVRSYLHLYLPAQCADGEGRGIEALRALAGEREVDRLLVAALSRRAGRVSAPEAVALRREAVELFASTGQPGEAAAERARLASSLQAAGDVPGAVREMEHALDDYRRLAMRDSFQDRFVAVALLNLGRLYSDAGRRGDAVKTLKAAVAGFKAIAREDHRFTEEVLLARQELRRVRRRRR